MSNPRPLYMGVPPGLYMLVISRVCDAGYAFSFQGVKQEEQLHVLSPYLQILFTPKIANGRILYKAISIVLLLYNSRKYISRKIHSVALHL